MSKPIITWSRWPNLETKLTAVHGIKWTYHEAFPINEIDWERSKKNQARIEGPIRPEYVDMIVEHALKMGRLELYSLLAGRPKGPADALVLADGNHRGEAARKLGLTTVGLYEMLDTGPETFDLMARSVNTMGGHGQDLRTQLAHASRFYANNAKRGVTIVEAASLWGLKKDALTRYVNVKELRARLSADGDLHVPGADKLSDNVLSRLHTLSTINQEILKLAVEGMVRVPKSGETLALELVRLVKTAKPKTPERQLYLVETEIARVIAETEEVVPAAKPKANRQTKLLIESARFLGVMEEAFSDADPRDVLTDEEKRARFAANVKKIKALISRFERGVG